ncbi:MAG: hypothetical protein GY750_10500 [Lentisphaerae bacterium]|nr:hypothetical protein [Lentisphaerota bacterium]MCP4101841.1 hypothetical protein [Lentisphaerota bacterium]
MKKFFVVFAFLLLISLTFPLYACEILGASFSKPVKISPLLTKFWTYGEKNPHGWGFATIHDGTVFLFKSPANAAHSQFAANMFRNSQYDNFIAHVRNASVGKTSYHNAHPFTRTLNNREYVMLHNGTLENDFRSALRSKNFSPVGQTDSEQAFCYVMDQIEKQKLERMDKPEFQALFKIFQKINYFGKFNCMLEVGDKLIVYQDLNRHNNLRFIKLHDNSKCLEQFRKDIAFQLPEDCEGYLFTARPLSASGNWTELEPGQMLVLEKGKIIFNQLPQT